MSTRPITDHDLHIHTYLSKCSSDSQQTKENILAYAKKDGFSDICITDHFWDSTVKGASEWYMPQNYDNVSKVLPMIEDEGVRMHFGCETELDKYMTLGLSPDNYDKFDFIIIPTTHLHMRYFTIEQKDISRERTADVYVRRLDGVLDMDLPFHKVGIAHLTCWLMAAGDTFPHCKPEDYMEHLNVLDLISDATFTELFTKMQKKGAGFELNFPIEKYSKENLPRVLRPYLIGKKCGCKFYFGSDSHHPADLDGAKACFEAIAKALDLKEENMFRPFG